MSTLGSEDASSLGSSGQIGTRSTDETELGRWMKTNGGIGCGWGSTYWNVGGPGTNVGSWTLEQRKDRVGFRIKRWETPQADEKACCLYAMSFEGSRWQEGGAAVRFQLYNGRCLVDRETISRGNLDRSSGMALKDTSTCGTGAMYWRHAAGGADAANLKGQTKCQKNNGFHVLMN